MISKQLLIALISMVLCHYAWGKRPQYFACSLCNKFLFRPHVLYSEVKKCNIKHVKENFSYNSHCPHQYYIFFLRTFLKVITKTLSMKEKDNFVNEVYVNAFFDYELKLNNNIKSDEDSDSSTNNRDKSFTSTRHNPERELEVFVGDAGVKIFSYERSQYYCSIIYS
ncbi:hypothetical protein V1477_004475 [Vespula maculifrons]|uniref:Uncharacterized protein n=1 Tax=Vespula maculifrons TaxID=7453 RepID=A0ABD2CUC8_VESMC